MAAADHHVMGDDDAAGCDAAVSRVVGDRAADAAHQTACERQERARERERTMTMGGGGREDCFHTCKWRSEQMKFSHHLSSYDTEQAHSCEKMQL